MTHKNTGCNTRTRELHPIESLSRGYDMSVIETNISAGAFSPSRAYPGG